MNPATWQPDNSTTDYNTYMRSLHSKQILRRGCKRQCPCCGSNIFHSFFRVKHHCDTCGYIPTHESGAVTGGMYVSAVVTEIFAVLVFLILYFSDVQGEALMPVCFLLVGSFALWFFPYSKSIWYAIDLITDLHSEEAFTFAYRQTAFLHDDHQSMANSVT